ncbi:hypothetical protein GE061_001966 [Apolygus lucorum]|uniref:Zinc finger protein-like 1 homolog n=1 Tax=Apolygus lucorum TaxID=248454 RepID=A0A8S9X553_APOLU|nr:hypothetical protein GE061_001966 [Apolygus lucorum]
MGLCKCPRKVVTTLFCYEHRVNVCEYCMVTSHSSCIIQSYYRWLHDTDYDPKCPLCETELSFQECIRLMCYHVFHWSCFKNHCDNLPATTAPAGYACTKCGGGVFPASYLISPVADELRKKLSTTEWGKIQVGCSGEGDSTAFPSNPPTQNIFHPKPSKPITPQFNETAPSSNTTSISRSQIERKFNLDSVLFKQHYSSLSPKASTLFSIEEEISDKYTRRRKPPFRRSLNYLGRSAYCKFVGIVFVSFMIICFLFVTGLPNEFDKASKD